MKKKVKGIYHGDIIKLLETVEAKEGEEVEVVFNDDEAEKELTPEEEELLAKTRGKWAGDTKIDEAFEELQEGWKQWQTEDY